jgi:hypothetical protein
VERISSIFGVGSRALPVLAASVAQEPDEPGAEEEEGGGFWNRRG